MFILFELVISWEKNAIRAEEACIVLPKLLDTNNVYVASTPLDTDNAIMTVAAVAYASLLNFEYCV